MSGKLATLIRLHRWRLDEQRRGLAAALRELDLRETALRELEAEIAAEQESARTAPAEAGIDYGAYVRQAIPRRATCRQAIATAEAEVSQRREQVKERYRELRTLELAEESRCRRAAAEAARRERLALDEVALLTRSRDSDGRLSYNAVGSVGPAEPLMVALFPNRTAGNIPASSPTPALTLRPPMTSPPLSPISPNWSEYATAYDKVVGRTATYRRLLDEIVGLRGGMGPVRDGSVILDLGCGTGNLCRDIIDRFPLCTVIAADRDPSMIELLRQNLADRLSGVPMPGRVFLLETEISGVFAQLGTLNLRPNYAFLVNVLYLLTDAECVLRETASCLADGGELRISNPSENSSVDQLLDRLKCDLVEAQEFPAMEGAFARVVRFNRDCLRPQLHRWSSAQIRSLLNAAGFSRIVYETHDHYGGQSILISAQK